MSEYQQQPKKRAIWPWVLTGCGVLIAGGIVFVVVIMGVVFGSMRSSDPYKEAMQRAQNDPRVTEALGTPIEAGFFVSGSINVDNASGKADLNVPIHGPKGKGSIHVVGTKEGGRWSYTRMLVTPASGPTIDLLSEESESTAPPAE